MSLSMNLKLRRNNPSTEEAFAAALPLPQSVIDSFPQVAISGGHNYWHR